MRKQLQAGDKEESGLTIIKCVEVDDWCGSNDLTDKGLFNIVVVWEGSLANEKQLIGFGEKGICSCIVGKYGFRTRWNWGHKLTPVKARYTVGVMVSVR